MARPTNGIRLSATKARQGRQALNMVWVLGVSLFLAAAALLLAWLTSA